MDNRFTLKDFIFLVLFALVLGAIGWSSYQFGYQEQRLNGVREQVQRLSDEQKEQTATLREIREALRGGVRVSTSQAGNADTQASAAGGRVRRKNPDGSLYVYYPQAPNPPRNPQLKSDYASGDWLVINLGNEPKVITPFIEKDAYGQTVQNFVLESLVTRNPETMELEPKLAESYTISADGLKLTFRLRPEAIFSDGKPVTADDVLFSFNTIRNPDVDCAPLRSYFGHISQVAKIDDRCVEFVFDEPYFAALEIAGGMSIIPEHVYKFQKGEDYNRRGTLLVGTGPFVVGSWDRGQKIVLERNDKYWTVKPGLDKLLLKFIKNPQAAFQDFQNVQLDSHAPDPDQWVKFSTDNEFLKRAAVYKYLRPDAGYSLLGYNLTRPMFKDKQTRQALTMLIDRTAIIHTFLKDLAVPIVGPFSTISPQNNPQIKPLPYDVEGAQAKLAAAGWKPGVDGVLVRDGVRFEFELMMGTGSPLLERLANYVKAQLERAGIQMKIAPYEFSVLGQHLDDRKFAAVFLSWTGSLEEDPFQIWHSSSIADKGSNFIGFRNPESDKLIEAARRTLVEKKRMELWHQWQALIYEEQPYTFMFTSMSRVFINNRFRNSEPFSTGLDYTYWYVPAAAQKYK